MGAPANHETKGVQMIAETIAALSTASLSFSLYVHWCTSGSVETLERANRHLRQEMESRVTDAYEEGHRNGIKQIDITWNQGFDEGMKSNGIAWRDSFGRYTNKRTASLCPASKEIS